MRNSLPAVNECPATHRNSAEQGDCGPSEGGVITTAQDDSAAQGGEMSTKHQSATFKAGLPE